MSEEKDDEKEKDEKEEESSSEEGEEQEEEEEEEEEQGEGEEEEEEEEEEEGEEEDDDATDEIAKRAAVIGEETELERIAREEEKKLAARKQKRRGKKGLQKAATKKLKKIGEKARPKRKVVTAVEAADPLIERSQKLGEWLRKNRKVTIGLVIAAVAALAVIGYMGYRDRQRSVEASVGLAAAVSDQRGRLGDPDKAHDEDPNDTTPVFRTAEARRDAALAKYRDVITKFPGTGAATIARLGEGALLLDKRDADGALSAFSDAGDSPLAKADTEVRGRALEGKGFAYELRADTKPETREADLENAIKTYRQLEEMDVQGFKELAMYHQARCYEAKGDKDKAKDLLKTLHERLAKPGDKSMQNDLLQLADDRLRALDPNALPPKRSGQMGPGGKLPPELLKQLQMMPQE